ncbi:hypothetical protein BDQ94DRAFT_136247 [Aspergillus welwitschiae]|uniref:Uncharacterized protein n=1 Tax=Aspergillus welwitschiae TaxID=1341132 RepID=A0A3F3QDQ5_9EURO|nr:hypothetical protein BDQ94DRAFT_136247 [Aspergillus welwitschiae]RDH37353.1 hypothetical protein BDQ94DRAFT_136247 [Aspergillus welwitschiae]
MDQSVSLRRWGFFLREEEEPEGDSRNTKMNNEGKGVVEINHANNHALCFLLFSFFVSFFCYCSVAAAVVVRY